MPPLDFPASPTNGQIFVGGNGVTYVWNGTLWLATGTSAGGDFYSLNSTGFPVVTWPLPATGVLTSGTLISGNSGGWYNATNGRYTPPAGRYFIYAYTTLTCSGAASHVAFNIRKNGAVVAASNGTTGAAGFSTELALDVTLDANGTDYFEIAAGAGNNNTAATGIGFGAYPISGVKGPPGDPGPAGSTPTGDFCAVQTSAMPAINGGATTVILTQVITGNSGGWYSTSTGRYTPPAGRYEISGGFSGLNTAGLTGFIIYLRKNGIVIAEDSDTTGAASHRANPRVSVILDANGSDWFDIQWLSTVGAASNSIANIIFQAFPISGIKGPPGDPPAGSLTLYNETILASPATSIAVTVPSGCKLFELHWEATLTGGVSDNIGLQAMISGTPYVAATHQRHTSYAVDTTPGAEANTNVTTWYVCSGLLGSGIVTGSLASSINSDMYMVATAGYRTTSNRVTTNSQLYGGPARNTVTGFRLTCATTLATGSSLRSYVVT